MNDKPILHENEEIRDVKGYEGIYAVTSYGRVWSYRSNKFLKPGKTSEGYYIVVFSVNNKHKNQKVHRLVAQAFLANPDGLPMVNHKDECKTNNHIFNLEWCDAKYNINYGTGNKRRSEKQSKPVRCVELNEVFESGLVAAAAVGLKYPTTIFKCCKGQVKTAAGYHWEYVKEGAAAC